MKSELNLKDPIDLSIPYGSEVAFKALMEIMERPFFALGKRKRTKPIEYEDKNVKITITSSYPWGIATIYDMDFMLWFSSRIIDKLNKDKKVSPVIEFTPYDCLKSLGRGTSGSAYKRFEEAMNRLFNTRIITTIREEDQFWVNEEVRGFNWLKSFNLKKEKTKSGREVVKGVSVTLSEWFYLGLLRRNSVLQIATDYFHLKSGLDRALYLIARKHVGRQAWWPFTMRKLYEKTGSDSPFKNFAINIRKIIGRNDIPEYVGTIERKNEEEIINIYNRSKLSKGNQFWEPERVNGKLPSWFSS